MSYNLNRKRGGVFMKRKILATTMVGVLCLSMLVGCGKGTEDTVSPVETPLNNSVDAMPINNNGDDGRVQVGSTPEKPEEEFDGSIYADMEWNMGTLGDTIQMKVDGYYGSFDMLASKEGMLMTIEYNIEHLAEVEHSPVSENAGNKVILYMPTTEGENICMYDDTQDSQNPKMIYFIGDTVTTSDKQDLEGDMSVKSMLADDITFGEYKRFDQESGKTLDICSVTLKSTQGQDIPCDAYIDRETKTLQKIVKTVDKENKYDYAMTIQTSESNVIEKPEWIDQCVEASEEQTFDILGAIFGMGLIMSDQDASNGLNLSDTEQMMVSSGEEIGTTIVTDALGHEQEVTVYRNEDTLIALINCVCFVDRESLTEGTVLTEIDLEIGDLSLSTMIDSDDENPNYSFDASDYFFEISDVVGKTVTEDKPMFSTVSTDYVK